MDDEWQDNVMAERKDWAVCGRVIGTATGWDIQDTFSMLIYDFEPHADYHGPVGKDICIDFGNGEIEVYDDDGKVVGAADLIDAIKDCPRDESVDKTEYCG